jgi:S1-C subfamily serine protease
LLAAKLQRGVTIPRQNFIANFNLIVNALSLGDLLSAGTPAFEEFGGKKPTPAQAPAPAQALDILDGISLGDLDERSRKQFGLPSEFGGKVVAGVLVTGVRSQSFGDIAGLKINDIITQMDRSRVGSARQATDLGQKLKHNQKLTLHVLTVSRLVTLVSDAKSEDEYPAVLGGLSVSDINDEWRRVFNLTSDTTGVVITVMDSDSVAIRAGLKVGDVILDMGGKRVTSAKQALELSKALKKDTRIRLRVLKDPSEADLVLEAKN